MGLIKTNYTSQSLGITVPEAYALIQELHIEGQMGRATFVIQSSRENAFTYRPIDVFEMAFEVNRNESPYVTAYNKAKGADILTITEWDSESNQYVTHPQTEPGPLYGWQDDIVE